MIKYQIGKKKQFLFTLNFNILFSQFSHPYVQQFICMFIQTWTNFKSFRPISGHVTRMIFNKQIRDFFLHKCHWWNAKKITGNEVEILWFVNWRFWLMFVKLTHKVWCCLSWHVVFWLTSITIHLTFIADINITLTQQAQELCIQVKPAYNTNSPFGGGELFAASFNGIL